MSINKNCILEVIKSAITPPESKTIWKNDPFEFLLEKLKVKLSENNLNNLIPEEDSDDAVPSTSTSSARTSTSSQVKTVNNDARVKYSRVLGRLYVELAKQLKLEKELSEDDYRLVSLQDLNTIASSLQFFVLTGVLPFLEPGVGTPANVRSSFVKSWKLYDRDIDARRKHLEFAASVILELCESNEAIRTQLEKKFIDDLVALRYQLLNVSITSFEERFTKLFDETPRDLLISALMGLCKPKKGKTPSPKWLQILCGAELSRILTKKDGLFYFLSYYTDIGGENWVENVPLRMFVAKHLATPPKIVKSSLAYHSNIFRQFLDLIDKSMDSSKENRSIIILLVAFVDEMCLLKNNSHNANLVIFDHFLRFWEVVAEKMTAQLYHSEKIEGFGKSEVRTLKILGCMMNIGGLAGNERILNLCLVFLGLADQNDNEIAESAMLILKGVLKNVKNPGELLYSLVMKDSRQLRVMAKETAKTNMLIEEVGEGLEEAKEADNDFPKELWIDSMEETDIGVAQRLENACEILPGVFDKNATIVLLEMLAKGVEDWMTSTEKENDDNAEFRFVGGQSDSRSSIHAHLIVGFCFEKIAALLSKDGFVENDERQLVLLLKIAENVLLKTSKTLKDFHKRVQEMDIMKLDDTEAASLESMVEISKMSIGLTSCVVFAASFQPDVLGNLEKTLKIAKEFVISARKCEDYVENLKSVADDATKLLEVMNLDMSSEPRPSTSGNVVGNAMKTSRNMCVCEDLVTDLRDETEEVAIRGGAIIQMATIFRKNNKSLAEKLISMNVFDDLKGIITHSDSYIFLSAINCLCEMACYDQQFLQKCIDLYSNLNNVFDEELPKSEVVIRKGRFGEALGKIFRAIGEVSVLYVDQIATIFVHGIGDDEEIIRASCCCALGDVVLASRGRGIEKLLDEMLYLLDSLILIDKSALVRRAAVDLVRQCIRSCATDVLQIMGSRLRDVRRKMVSLWKYDRDDVVRLHAQLCIEELKNAMDDILEEETSRYCRKIRI